jgi:hypothetical protein
VSLTQNLFWEVLPYPPRVRQSLITRKSSVIFQRPIHEVLPERVASYLALGNLVTSNCSNASPQPEHKIMLWLNAPVGTPFFVPLFQRVEAARKLCGWHNNALHILH